MQINRYDMFLWSGSIVISVGLAYISRASFRSLRPHGFYRFFAWEAILALMALNLPVWIVRPLAWHQLISWPLLVASLFLVIHSFILLRNVGKPQANAQSVSPRQDPALLGLEKTTILVTKGAYRWIRHPLYSSLLLLTWGVFFKKPSLPGVLLAVVATIFLMFTARSEEAENLRFFGLPYQEYMQRTKMFIPYIF